MIHQGIEMSMKIENRGSRFRFVRELKVRCRYIITISNAYEKKNHELHIFIVLRWRRIPKLKEKIEKCVNEEDQYVFNIFWGYEVSESIHQVWSSKYSIRKMKNCHWLIFLKISECRYFICFRRCSDDQTLLNLTSTKISRLREYDWFKKIIKGKVKLPYVFYWNTIKRSFETRMIMIFFFENKYASDQWFLGGRIEKSFIHVQNDYTT